MHGSVLLHPLCLSHILSVSQCDRVPCEEASHIANASGYCNCNTGGGYVLTSTGCWRTEHLAITIAVPIIVTVILAILLYSRHKLQQADSVWKVAMQDLEFGDPCEVLGRGTFGLVVAATYRSTSVAVKRVLPQGKRKTRVSFLGEPVSTGTNKSSASFATTLSMDDSIKFTSSNTSMDFSARGSASMDLPARTTNGMRKGGPDERGRRSVKDGNVVTELVHVYIDIYIRDTRTRLYNVFACVHVRACACARARASSRIDIHVQIGNATGGSSSQRNTTGFQTLMADGGKVSLAQRVLPCFFTDEKVTQTHTHTHTFLV